MLNKYDKKWLSDFQSFERKVEEDGEDLDSNEKYFLEGLSKLYEMMLTCNQSETSVDTPKKVKRVIRVNRYVDKYILQKHYKDWYLCNGLFLVVDAYLIPEDIVECCLEKNGCYGGPSFKNYDCPTDKEYIYSSIRKISNDTYMVIKKDGLLEHMLNYEESWYYVGQKEV